MRVMVRGRGRGRGSGRVRVRVRVRVRAGWARPGYGALVEREVRAEEDVEHDARRPHVHARAVGAGVGRQAVDLLRDRAGVKGGGGGMGYGVEVG